MQYDVAPDGHRLLVFTATGGAEGTSALANITVVQNWLEELRRLVRTN